MLKSEDQIRNSLLVVENHGERSTCTNQASKRQNNQQNPNFGTNVLFLQNDVDCQNTVHYNMQYQKNLMSKVEKSGQNSQNR